MQVYPIVFNQSWGNPGALNYQPNEAAAFSSDQAIKLVALNVATFVNPGDRIAFAAAVAAAQAVLACPGSS